MTKAPRWCAVDLRDGNQALIDPMSPERKRRMFDLLVRMGYKEIEVGFPSASQTDFDFVRQLIEDDLIPDDVDDPGADPGARAPDRAHLRVDRAAPSRRSCTSTTRRPCCSAQVVFRPDQDGIIDIALQGARLCRKLEETIPEHGGLLRVLARSPTPAPSWSSRSRICNEVLEVFEPTPGPQGHHQPAGHRRDGHAERLRRLDRVDDAATCTTARTSSCRCTRTTTAAPAIAAAELGYLAGADRIEGCLFGNGERTGNVYLVTLGMNLFTQGIDPQIDFSDIDEIRRTVEYCNQLPVHERHPYGGDLVFTAFSGSHQDAIKKGFEAMAGDAEAEGKAVDDLVWAVPYLPIDPKDLGRSYEAVIRVNSQSGKGGVAYLLKSRARPGPAAPAADRVQRRRAGRRPTPRAAR